jgi:phosphate transport system substrate-binding protein
METPTTRRIRLSMVTPVVVLLSGCAAETGSDPRANGAAAAISGAVTVDGSSTVLPVSRVVTRSFLQAHAGVTVSVQASGTGGGFQKFCNGGIDIVGSSRPINRDEQNACQTKGIDYIELPVAFDSLSVVVNRANSFASCLTVGELKHLWEPGAERVVTRWDQVRPGFPARSIALFGPGSNSGTFDYFTLAIVGTERSSRQDYTASEDDEVLAKGVAENVNAMAYFGFAYYLAHQDTLKLVAIDNGQGCVTPGAETVADNTYQPLSRPIFIYVNEGSARRPAVHALARSYVDPENAKSVQDVGYVPLPTATLLAGGRRLDRGVTGSLFAGRGSVLGLTAASFEDDDRIKSALVR